MVTVHYVHEKFDKSMRVSTKSLQFIGLYPFVVNSKYQRNIAFLSGFIICLTMVHVFYSMYDVRYESLVDIADKAVSSGVSLLAFVKFYLMKSYGSKYEKLVCRLRNDLWLNKELKADSNKLSLIKYCELSRKLTIALQIVTAVALVVFALSPLAVMVFLKLFTDSHVNFILPFDTWCPCDKNKLHWYIIHYLYECLAQAVIVWTFFSCDAINLAVITHVYIHLDCLKSDLNNLVLETEIPILDVFCKRQSDILITGQNIEIRLKNLVLRHIDLIEIAREFENLIGIILLLNFALGSIFICLTGFTFSMVDDPHRKITFFIYFCTMIVIIFDHCFYGQHLSDLSVAIPESIYSSLWYMTDRRVQRNLQFVIQRAQKPLKMSAMGYVDMNFITFTRVVSTSWSYFTLLKTVYDD